MGLNTEPCILPPKPAPPIPFPSLLTRGVGGRYWRVGRLQGIPKPNTLSPIISRPKSYSLSPTGRNPTGIISPPTTQEPVILHKISMYPKPKTPKPQPCNLNAEPHPRRVETSHDIHNRALAGREAFSMPVRCHAELGLGLCIGLRASVENFVG